jgi:carbon monoxide dehydrogenase subunit G
MKLTHTALIRAPRAKVWKLVTDVPAAARCVPGVAAVTPSGSGKYKGSRRRNRHDLDR